MLQLVWTSKAKEVIGAELNKDAVKDNAKINNIKFINEDASAFMVKLAKQH